MLEAADVTADIKKWNAGRLSVTRSRFGELQRKLRSRAVILSAVAGKIAAALKGTYGAAGPKET